MHNLRASAALLALSAAGRAACGHDDDPPAPTQTLAEQCPSLAGAALTSATVTAAAVAAASGAHPESCVVQVKMTDSALRFEARLPTTGWNEKLAFLGGGGFGGTIANAGLRYHSESILAERSSQLLVLDALDHC